MTDLVKTSVFLVSMDDYAVTVTGVLQLVDDDLVGLDDPIGDYIPGVPEGDRITLRQLARMQSGLFNYSEDEQFQLDLVTDP